MSNLVTVVIAGTPYLVKKLSKKNHKALTKVYKKIESGELSEAERILAMFKWLPRVFNEVPRSVIGGMTLDEVKRVVRDEVPKLVG